jgi:hypothetical protein
MIVTPVELIPEIANDVPNRLDGKLAIIAGAGVRASGRRQRSCWRSRAAPWW